MKESNIFYKWKLDAGNSRDSMKPELALIIILGQCWLVSGLDANLKNKLKQQYLRNQSEGANKRKAEKRANCFLQPCIETLYRKDNNFLNDRIVNMLYLV